MFIVVAIIMLVAMVAYSVFCFAIYFGMVGDMKGNLVHFLIGCFLVVFFCERLVSLLQHVAKYGT